MIPWHRLFGLILGDFFSGTAWEVVLELDLSRKVQRLDIVVVRRGEGPIPQELPDGFGPLAEHNLITFKSLREPLDGWALKELVGHAVNYRKQVSPSLDVLIPESDVRLFGIAMRFPRKLAEQVKLEQRSDGVYEVQWGTDRICVLVLSEVPETKGNAVWNLFSGDADRIQHAALWYHGQRSEISTILNQLFENYQAEGVTMPYTVEDFMRDVTLEHLKLLPPEERLRGLPPEERLRGLPPEERLRGLPPEERLRGLSNEEIEEYLRRRRGGFAPERRGE